MEKVKKVLLVVFVMMFFIGIIPVTDFGKMKKYQNNEVTDLANLGYRQMQTGDLVSGKVDYVLDTVAEEYETKFGIRTSDDSTKLYYIISLPNSYAVYETSNKEEYDTLDKICNETWDYLNSEDGSAPAPTSSLMIQGEVKKMDDKVAGYFKDWFKEQADFSDEDFEKNTEVYMISRTKFDGFQRSVYTGIGLAAVGAVGLIVLLVLKIKAKKQSSQEFY